MSAIAEKSGGTFEGIKLLLCENPLPPIDKATQALPRPETKTACPKASR
jgi:hypothetical protein